MNGSGLTKLTPEVIIKIPKRTLAELAAPAPSGERPPPDGPVDYPDVQAARKLLASGTLQREVAHSLVVSVPTLYRWVPASSRI